MNNLKGILIVPIALAIILVPFSLLIGWNLLTLFLFWFVLTPVLAVDLPARVSKNQNHLIESILGLVIFYGLMVFMIYEHYQTDYFRVMIFSLLVNLISILVIRWVRSPETQVQQ